MTSGKNYTMDHRYILDNSSFHRMAFKREERLEAPTQAPAIILKILEKCWKHNSGDRIRFSEIEGLLQCDIYKHKSDFLS